MSSPSAPAPHAFTPPIAPSEAQWRALSAAAREQFLVHANAVLTAEAERVAMSEGRPHKRAKNRALDRLGQYLRRIGRQVYLADEMAVHYPGEEVFAPDVLAVLDVADPGDDDARQAWVVVDEGRGLDWVLEVHYLGDREKDFVRNVERYARLGIPEYFLYDRRSQALRAFRLPPGGRRYQPIRGHFGRFPSLVLGVDLAVIGGRLRFFAGDAELPGSEDLINQLGRMVDELQERQEQAEARAEEERARAEEERARAVDGQRRTLLEVLAARGLPVGEPVRAAILACSDGAELSRWTVRAATATTDREVIAEPSPAA